MKKRRILAWALSLSMVVSSFSFHVFAQEEDVVSDTQAEVVADVSEDADAPEESEVSSDAVVSSSAVDVAADAASTTNPAELLAVDEWVGSNTSTAVITDDVYSVNADGNSVNLKVYGNAGEGKGKLSGGEDSMVYYATELDADLDFTLSANVKVNDLNSGDKASNPQQSGYGLAVLNSLYDKAADGTAFTSGAFGTFAMDDSKATIGKIGLRPRVTKDGKTGNSAVANKDIVSLARAKNITGGGDTFVMTLNKTGNIVTFTVDGNSESYEFTQEDLGGTIYPMFFVARNADVTFSDIKYTHDPQKVVGVKVKTPPDKTTFVLNQELDLSGMEVEATYADGSTAVVEDYKVTGYDNTVASTQTLTITKGSATATLDVVVEPVGLTGIKINVVPFETVYHSGMPFSASGLDITAEFNDGSTKTYKNGENTYMTVEGVELVDGEDIAPAVLALNKDVDVKVTLKESDNYSISADAYATYKATVSSSALQAISIAYVPETTSFFIGDEFNSSGLTVVGVYTDGYSEVLAEDKYTVTGFDSQTAGVKTITVASVADPSIKATYDVKVNEKKQERLKINTYPKTTYDVGEAWSADGLSVVIVYNSLDEVEAKVGTDYTIDTSKFDSSEAGTTYVTLVPTNKDFDEISLPLTVRNVGQVYWNDIVFGQSSTGVNAGDPSSEIKHNSDGSVTVRSWHGSGKITGDHDGIAYYYTRVNPADNFSLSADIYVRGYLGTHPGNGSEGYYNVDEKRTGQEAFGIMARDVIPLEAKDGFGNDNGVTVLSSEANLDENGEPIGKNRNSDVFSSNIAIAGGYSGTSWPPDPTAASYYKNANIDRINLYVRAGVEAIDGGGTKYGPNAVSSAFPQAGLYSPSTYTKFNGTEDEETREGDKYNITLERVNVQADPATGAITRRGLKATCVYLGPDESRKGETMTTYMSDEVMDTLFSVQSSEDAYVGFFAARWGIIDVSNIKFSVSDPATDPVYDVVLEEPVTPYLNVRSSLYTSDKDYTLILQANNDNGGFLTLKKGEETLYHQLQIGKKRMRISLTLDENAANTYTAVYTPSKLDYLTSYDDVVNTFTVYHRSSSDSDYIYVSPDGQSEAYVDAAGVSHTAGSSREYPMDLVTAIGFIQDGQTIVMMDGTYKSDKTITIALTNSGSKGKVKSMIADEGATPVIDLMGQGSGLEIGGSYWYIKGIQIINCADQQHAIVLGGKYDTLENVKVHDNGGSGIQISRMSGTQEYFEDWPSNNVVRYCEAWNNADSSKINADGFAAKLTVGNGNVFDNCVSHHNADDGWDLYTKLASGPIGEVSLVNCATYLQGYVLQPDGTHEAYGQGGHNGFKMGGENIYVFHYIKDSLSFMNEKAGSGVSSNSNPALKLRNTVFYNNESRGVSLYSSKPAEYCYDVKGVISFANGGGKDIIGGSLNQDTNFVNHATTDPMSAEANNYLNVTGEGCVNTATGVAFDPSEVFVSTDFDAATVGERFEQNADGSFNFKGFLQRKVPYVHDEADEVKMFGCFYTGDEEEVTVTEATTQATTRRSSASGSSDYDNDSSASSSKYSRSGGSGSAKASASSSGSAATQVGTPSSRTAADSKPTTTDTPAGVSAGKNGKASGSSSASSAAFNDISHRPWAAEAIAALSETGVINGVGNGSFAPDAKTRRCDFIVMLTRLLGIEGTATENFDDVPSTAYYANAVGLAKQLGITNGVDGKNFYPSASITRQDMMVLVARALEVSGVSLNKDTAVLSRFSDESGIADYAKPYVAALVNLGVVSGTGNSVEPNVDITRAQTAVLLYNLAATAAPKTPATETVE